MRKVIPLIIIVLILSILLVSGCLDPKNKQNTINSCIQNPTLNKCVYPGVFFNSSTPTPTTTPMVTSTNTSTSTPTPN